MANISQEHLNRINKQINDTYHSPKNKETLPIALFFSVIAIIFKNPLFWESIIWFIYYWYCDSNNKKWRNNSYNIKEREFLIEYKKKLLNGEFDHYL